MIINYKFSNIHIIKGEFMKRDMNNAVFFGVCSGISRHFNIDVSYVRVGFVFATLFFGAPLLIYPILALILPEG